MNLTDNIINLALLGTASKEVALSDFPEELQDSVTRIRQMETEQESCFYNGAALLFAYYRAGMEPVQLPDGHNISEALPETLPYMEEQAASLLSTLLRNKNNYLLLYAYERAVQTRRLLPPVYIPLMLEHAFAQNTEKAWREKQLLMLLVGNRGQWLIPQMGLAEIAEESVETWDTAPHVARKLILTKLRATDAGKGRELLELGLSEETAAHRTELLECMQINLSVADEPFLANLYVSDRSVTVREVVLRLLQGLPDSAFVKYYENALRGKLSYRKLLGWSVGKIEYSQELKNAGIEEVSPNKKESDSDYILRQLAERVPLSFWCEILDCGEENAAARLAEKPPFERFFNLETAIRRFNDSRWAYFTLLHQSPTNMSLLELILPEEREKVRLEFSGNDVVLYDGWFGKNNEPWGERFSLFVINMMFKSRYFYYTKDQVEKLALYMPLSIVPQVQRMSASFGEDTSYRIFCDNLLYYLGLKAEINKVMCDA